MEQWLMNGGANSLTVITVLVIIIFTGARGIWLFAYQSKKEIDRLEKIITDNEAAAQQRVTDLRTYYEARLDDRTVDRDEWREMARAAANIGDRATDVAKTVAEQKGTR